MFLFYIEITTKIRCYHFYTLLARVKRIIKFLCVSILMLFICDKKLIKRLVKLFSFYMYRYYKYQLEKRIKKVVSF